MPAIFKGGAMENIKEEEIKKLMAPVQAFVKNQLTKHRLPNMLEKQKIGLFY